MPSITINGVSINPSAPRPQRAALALDNANAKNSDYILVQTKAPLDKAQRAQLEKASAEILEAVPGSALVRTRIVAQRQKVRDTSICGAQV